MQNCFLKKKFQVHFVFSLYRDIIQGELKARKVYKQNYSERKEIMSELPQSENEANIATGTSTSDNILDLANSLTNPEVAEETLKSSKYLHGFSCLKLFF